jgi:hypothetical protein
MSNVTDLEDHRIDYGGTIDPAVRTVMDHIPCNGDRTLIGLRDNPDNPWDVLPIWGDAEAFAAEQAIRSIREVATWLESQPNAGTPMWKLMVGAVRRRADELDAVYLQP